MGGDSNKGWNCIHTFYILPVCVPASGNVSTRKGILSFWSSYIFRWEAKMTRVETVYILFTYFLFAFLPSGMCQLKKELFPFGVDTFSDGEGKMTSVETVAILFTYFLLRFCHLEMCQLKKEFFPFGFDTFSDGRGKWQELKLYPYFLHTSCCVPAIWKCVNSKRNSFLLEFIHFQMGGDSDKS